MLSFGPKKELPDITDLINKGYSYQQVIDELKKKGYDDDTIKEVLVKNSAAFKFNQQASSNIQLAPNPSIASSVNAPQGNPQTQNIQEIQAILEQIIEEKWKGAYKDIDVINDKIKQLQSSIDSLTFSLSQVNKRVDDIQGIILAKNEEFNKSMQSVNIELQALDKVMMELIPTLSNTIREMRDLVEQLKSLTNKDQKV